MNVLTEQERWEGDAVGLLAADWTLEAALAEYLHAIGEERSA